MPRRSGTMTVWLATSLAAIGAHISPVSPKPCSSTTAGPRPPVRTYSSVPLVLIVWVLKLVGKGSIAQPGAATSNAANKAAEKRIIKCPRLEIARLGLVKINLATRLLELFRLLGHGGADFGRAHGVVLALGGVAHFLADLHGTEFRPA